MMKFIFPISHFTLFILIAINSMAQDVIIKVNGEKIDCSVISVSDNQVVYKINGDNSSKYLGKTYVKEIIYGPKNETKPQIGAPKETKVENNTIDVEKMLESKDPSVNNKKSEKDSCDNIILRSGEEISSKVIEVGVTEIKYRKCPKANGPLYSVLKSDVFMIQYSNGKKDIMPEEKIVQKTKEEEPDVRPRKPMAEEKSKIKYYTTVGLYAQASDNISFHFNGSIHYQPVYFFSAGIGTGFFMRHNPEDAEADNYTPFLPIAAEFKFLLSKHRFSPIISLNAGYLFALKDMEIYSSQNVTNLGGTILNAEFGIRVFNYNRLGLIVSLSYYRNFMTGVYHYTWWNGSYHQGTQDYKSDYGLLGLNVGITF